MLQFHFAHTHTHDRSSSLFLCEMKTGVCLALRNAQLMFRHLARPWRDIKSGFSPFPSYITLLPVPGQHRRRRSRNHDPIISHYHPSHSLSLFRSLPHSPLCNDTQRTANSRGRFGSLADALFLFRNKQNKHLTSKFH